MSIEVDKRLIISRDDFNSLFLLVLSLSTLAGGGVVGIIGRVSDSSSGAGMDWIEIGTVLSLMKMFN